MKLNYLLGFLVAAAAPWSFASQCSQPHDWDWSEESSFATMPTSFPFYRGNYIGVDLKHFHCPEDGWLLYAKSSACDNSEKYGLPCFNTKTGAPYFTLYNKYSGLLRLFIWIPRENFTGENNKNSINVVLNTTHKSLPDDSDNMTTPTGSPEGSNNKLTQETVFHIPEYFTGIWTVSDYYLDYAEEELSGDLSFQVEVYANTNSEVYSAEENTMSLYDATSHAPDANFSLSNHGKSGFNSIKYVNTVEGLLASQLRFSSVNLMSENSDSLTKAGFDLRDLSNWMNEKQATTDTIGPQEASFRAIKSLTGSSDTIHIQYTDLNLALTEGIKKQGVLKQQFSFPVHGLNQFMNDSVMTDLQFEHSDTKLGVFNFTSQPNFIIKPSINNSRHDYVGYVKENIRDLININPALENELEIETVTIQPEFEVELSQVSFSYNRRVASGAAPRNKTLLSPDGFATSHSQTEYSYTPNSNEEVSILLDGGKRYAKEFSSYAEQMEDASLHSPVSFGSTAEYFKHRWRNNTYHYEKYKYLIDDVSIKVFVKLRHKEKKDIYFDYVDYLRPNIEVCNYSQQKESSRIFSDDFDTTRVQAASDEECSNAHPS